MSTTDLKQTKIHPRRDADVKGVIQQLQEHPGEWIEYSEHRTRGAARQRIHSLRAGANFRQLPVEWATRRDRPGDIGSPVRVYVRWLPGAPVNLSGADTLETASQAVGS